LVPWWWAAQRANIVVRGRARVLSGLLGLLALVFLSAQPTRVYRAQAAPAPVAAGTFIVTGTVTDQQHAPVANVQVFAFRAEAPISTYTNSSGQFTLALPAGAYDIVFNPPSGSHLAARSMHQIIDQSQVLTIMLAPGHTISGTVRDAAHSMPVANTAIFAFNTATSDRFGLPPSGADGTYNIALVSGTWALTFTPPSFMGLGPTSTSVPNLTTDISRDIALPPGFTLSGHVTAPGGNHAGVAGVEVFAKDPGQPAGYGFAPTSAGGWYTGTLPLGMFDIQFLAPPFTGLGSTVITNVAGPADVRRDLVLPSGYTVSGHTYLANTFVLAIPHPPLSNGHFEGWGQFAGTDRRYALALQPGIYSFRSSPPGSAASGGLSMIRVQGDLVLNFGFYLYLPLIQEPVQQEPLVSAP
jgi:hypothetical protein